VAWIKQFPQVGSILIRVPSGPDNTLHSYRFAAKERTVPVLTPDDDRPNLNWHPIVGARVEGDAMRASNESDLFVDAELTRCAIWLTRFNASDGSLPDVHWQLRAASNCTSEVISQGIIQLEDEEQVGLIVHASGWLCNQFEFWCRIVSGSVTADLGIDVLVSRSEPGSSPSVFKGSVGV
jgi:hypothetical protein